MNCSKIHAKVAKEVVKYGEMCQGLRMNGKHAALCHVAVNCSNKHFVFKVSGAKGAL
jgi:hypothetical protein